MCAKASPEAVAGAGSATLFLCGDVMAGRGVDQVMGHPSDPLLHESWVEDARDYVALAEAAYGPIPRQVGPSYPWGDALAELLRMAPVARVINLETSVTRSDDYWRGKGINYRMHPENVGCLAAARIDVCTLANNHVLDYGYPGLEETVETLRAAGFATAGAGRNAAAAREPAVLALPGKGRLIVFAFGSPSSGIPPEWAATEDRPGVDFLDDLSGPAAREAEERIRRARRPGDVVIAAIHWGTNWGYEVPAAQVRFAHRLVDAGADIVCGHSSHHPRPVEVFRGRLVLYGCGDLLNDYEGIKGYEEYRGDLVSMFFPTIDRESGALCGLTMTPMQVRRFQLRRAAPADAKWLEDTLNRTSRPFGARVFLDDEGRLELPCPEV